MLGKKRKVRRINDTDAVDTGASQNTADRCRHHLLHEDKLKEMGADIMSLKTAVQEITTRHKVAVTVIGILSIVLGACGSVAGAILSPILMAFLKTHGAI